MSNPEAENPMNEENQGPQEAQPATGMPSPVEEKLQALVAGCEAIRGEIHKMIIGQDEYINLLIATLLSDGHALVEGVPGIAKTLTAKLMAKTLDMDFSRIQFTPDLMPADVVGTNVFQVKISEFAFKPGPVFSQVVLIDEINRAPAKTQSALFEVMEERQVTLDGTSHPMKAPFIVLATQNPLEQEGTYKLPEAQMDRFLFRITISYPSESEEIEMLERFSTGDSVLDLSSIKSVLNGQQVREFRELVNAVRIEAPLRAYIARIIHNTRTHPDLYLGASPRASLATMRSAKAFAAMAGRDFVSPDDIRRVLYHVLNHRITLTPEREMEGITLNDVLNDIIENIEVPR